MDKKITHINILIRCRFVRHMIVANVNAWILTASIYASLACSGWKANSVVKLIHATKRTQTNIKPSKGIFLGSLLNIKANNSVTATICANGKS